MVLMMMMKKETNKILVTGGSGLIGSFLKKNLPNAIYISSKDFDLTNQNDVERMFSIHKPNIVIHLAAKTSGLINNINHLVNHLDDNLLMNTLVLKYAHINGVERFLSILSCCIYPNLCDTYPLKECVIHDGPPNSSVFSYGMSKRIMATQIENYNKEHGTKYNYIIPCNLYGPNDKDDKIIPVIINKIKVAKENGDSYITLFGDGTPIRQFVHSMDMSNVIENIIKNDITESFNLASEEIITIDGLARMILEITDSNNLEIKYDSTKPNGQIRRDLDICKFKKIMPDYKFISLYDGIKQYYNG